MAPPEQDDTQRFDAVAASAGSATPASLIGRTVQGLKIKSLLGRGGMGEVYKAFDPNLRRFVAIKMVRTAAGEEDPFAARFQREAQTASALHHPNIAQIYSAGEHEGRPFYVMEHVEGQSLAEVLEAFGPLIGRRCLSYLIQAAEGLREAQRAGIVHRDIKPANLMLDREGRLKIVDFGLARQMASDSTLTQSNMVVGTPAYLAPEQALGGELDHRADIYALGATFYHLFSGELPFEADTPLGLLMKHAKEPLPPLKQRNPRVPQAVCAVIERMLAKDPAHRYADYDGLIADLRAIQDGSGSSRDLRSLPPQTPPPSASSPAKSQPAYSQPVLWIGAGLLFLLGIALLVPSGSEHQTGDEIAADGPPAVDASDEEPRTGAGERRPRGIPASVPHPAFDPTPLQQSSAIPEEPAPPPTPLPRPTRIERLTEAMGSGPVIAMAHRSQTMAQMRRLQVAAEMLLAENGYPPNNLEELSHLAGLTPRELVDSWGTRVRLQPLGQGVRLSSAGADGRFGSADDIVLENGYFVRGGRDAPP